MKQKISKIIVLSLSLWLIIALNLSAQVKLRDYVPQNQFKEIFTKIRQSGEKHQPLRILHVGDSHIKGGHTTEPLANSLREAFGEFLEVQEFGINGATFLKFSYQEQLEAIQSYNPELIIVSLGTNDCYTSRFSLEEVKLNMEVFFYLLQQKLPNVPIVLTTPPASFLKTRVRLRRRRYKTRYHYNGNVQTVSNTIYYIARSHNFACIDVYGRMGDRAETAEWLSEGLLRQDRVHYSAEGYQKIGHWIAEALITFIKEDSASED